MSHRIGPRTDPCGMKSFILELVEVPVRYLPCRGIYLTDSWRAGAAGPTWCLVGGASKAITREGGRHQGRRTRTLRRGEEEIGGRAPLPKVRLLRWLTVYLKMNIFDDPNILLMIERSDIFLYSPGSDPDFFLCMGLTVSFYCTDHTTVCRHSWKICWMGLVSSSEPQ